MSEKSVTEEAPEFKALAIDHSQSDQESRQRREGPKHTVVSRFSELLCGSPH